MVDHAEALQNVYAFKDFPKAELQKLAAIAEHRYYGPKTVLCNEGEGQNDLYVILMGTVRVLKYGTEGEEEITTLGSGATVGEIAFVLEELDRSATLETKEPTSVLVFAHTALDKLLATDPGLAARVYRGLARSLANRLRSTTAAAANLKAQHIHHHH